MSIARFNTLKDVSGSNPMAVADINLGRTKAWLNYTSLTTTVIRDSFGISSITDTAVGTSRVDFATAFANANFSVTACAGNVLSFAGVSCDQNDKNAGYQGNIYTWQSSSITIGDVATVQLAFHGRL